MCSRPGFFSSRSEKLNMSWKWQKVQKSSHIYGCGSLKRFFYETPFEIWTKITKFPLNCDHCTLHMNIFCCNYIFCVIIETCPKEIRITFKIFCLKYQKILIHFDSTCANQLSDYCNLTFIWKLRRSNAMKKKYIFLITLQTTRYRFACNGLSSNISKITI